MDFDKPRMKTAYPGPKHQAAMDKYNDGRNENPYKVRDSPLPQLTCLKINSTDTYVCFLFKMERFVNLKQSKGNFFVDLDGNRFLDLHCNFSHLPLGYNHDALINVNKHIHSTF